MKQNILILPMALCASVLLLGCANQNNLGYAGQGTPTGYETVNVPRTDAPTTPSTQDSTPTATDDGAQLSVENTVFFRDEQAVLTPQAEAILDAQARWLSQHPRNVLIEGHADEQGTREYNVALGARRAAAVRDYLVTRGVDYGRIKTTSYGKERPLELCSEESCWAKNRRAVTVLR